MIWHLTLQANRKWRQCHAIHCVCVDWLCWWYIHVAYIVPPWTALAFGNKMSEKHKSTSPNAIQVKNRWKTISIEEKLDVISQLEKGEQTVDICYNVRFTPTCICTVHDNADRITESDKLGTKCLCSKTTTVLSEWTIPKTSISYIFIAFEINKYIV